MDSVSYIVPNIYIREWANTIMELERAKLKLQMQSDLLDLNKRGRIYYESLITGQDSLSLSLRRSYQTSIELEQNTRERMVMWMKSAEGREFLIKGLAVVAVAELLVILFK